MQVATWSKPYCGVTHAHAEGKKSRVTVNDYNSFANLLLWFPGCGFSPTEQMFDDVDSAKVAGEAWLLSGAAA